MAWPIVTLTTAFLLLAAPAIGEDPCAAWPGEPDPLPASTDADGALARWAQLRSLELRALAERSARDPLTADRLTRHADCLAPLRAPPPEAPVPRTHLAVRVHRPGLALASQRAPVQELASVDAALASLGEPLPIARRSPPRPPPVVAAARTAPEPPAAEPIAPELAAPEPIVPEPAPELTAPEPIAPELAAPEPIVPEPAPELAAPEPIAPELAAPEPIVPELAAPEPLAEPGPEPAVAEDSEPLSGPLPDVAAAPPLPMTLDVSGLRETRSSLQAARFEEALARASRGRAELAATEGADARRAGAELEVLAGTAALALGRDAEASDCFARARSLDPSLSLDPVHHSPKVVDAFAAAEPLR
jgi:hypothetical protein